MIQQVNNTELNIVINCSGLHVKTTHSFRTYSGIYRYNTKFGFEVFKIATDFHGGCFPEHGRQPATQKLCTCQVLLFSPWLWP
jgi:hypothetical protein